MAPKPVIAIAGAGDLSKYFVEEILADGTLEVLVCSSQAREWCLQRNVQVAITDYSTDSVVNILDSAAAVALCVFYVNYDDDRFLTVSHSLLEACAQSKTCKRIIPSEWAGDVRAFPTVPRYYKTTRIPMRETLRSQTDIEWTIVCPGFFMDYVVPVEKTYLKDYPDMLPWDRSLWEATLPGTGNEDVVVSSARDVMKATVQILKQPKWENYTYVLGERTTLNKIALQMEEFYGRPFTKKSYLPHSKIEGLLEAAAGDPVKATALQLVEWLAIGATDIPEVEVQVQRKKYFSNVHFRTVGELLDDSRRLDKV